MARVISLADFHRHEPWNAPDEPDYGGCAEDAIEARIDEIWADANLLHYALDDASMPFSLHTCALLRDAALRLNQRPNVTRSDSDLVILGLVDDLHTAVLKAATHDIENPSSGDEF